MPVNTPEKTVGASLLAPTNGSKYDRENQVGCQAASRASFTPTNLMGVRPGEPGRLLGRLAADVDLGAPLTTMAERRHCSVGPPRRAIHGPARLPRHPCRGSHYAMPAFGHAEPRRGTEWWGKAFLMVTFLASEKSDPP
ncbi:Hypothetical protein PSEBR_m1690 [Pseudomonas brassicacearum subsp. brassicacearum NFM421]|uniref:Uncharacterized protein n=1 Tax=Pseudomonas brassicacearum (strain NFM421) TaxID=994484 RepID=F2K6F0_PSEBN|nr:Hypothetical protein PSEBR_m1690 [Pseudomonas brassicacearum subsp. brassicacearum NFM421]